MAWALDQAELQENIRLEMKLLTMLRTHGREGRTRSAASMRSGYMPRQPNSPRSTVSRRRWLSTAVFRSACKGPPALSH